MLPVDTLTLTTVGATSGGHIILVDIEGQRYSALRVTTAEPTPQDVGVLVLNYRHEGQVQPTVFQKMSDDPCIDLGHAQVRVDERSRASDLGIGHLIVHEHGIAISARDHGNRLDRTNWSLRDGSVASVGESAMRFPIWSVGIQHPGGPYIALADFPPPKGNEEVGSK